MKEQRLNKFIWLADEKNIWHFRQNHPELVIKDIKRWFPVPLLGDYIQKLVRQSMLCRGINKWLKVRRDLIAYKKLVRHEICDLMKEIPELKKQMTEKWVDFDNATPRQITDYFKAREKYLIAKELLKYKEKIRRDLKKMCMTERWQMWCDKDLREMNTIRASDN